MNNIDALLVIGNGFDLQCGLKSSYEDFFKWLRQDNKRACDNLWAIHFLNNSPEGQHWTDVEESLRKVWLEYLIPGNSKTEIWEREALKIYNDIAIVPTKITTSRREDEAFYIAAYMKHKMRRASVPLDKYWYLEELKKFESQFSEYLKAEVSNNEKYLPNVCKLMDMLVGNEKVNVISFNYTNPFSDSDSECKLSEMVTSVTNVHGTYNSDNIIFGVDSTEKLTHNAHIFSKTHRKLLLPNPNRALPWHVQKVKFYGHSLGKADYSYFQSIFDSYALYGGDLVYTRSGSNPVELHFYFTVYNEDKKSAMMRSAADNVYKLITAYGSTIDNKDKGKNLLHKLLLEGRVKIEFLPNIEDHV